MSSVFEYPRGSAPASLTARIVSSRSMRIAASLEASSSAREIVSQGGDADDADNDESEDRQQRRVFVSEYDGGENDQTGQE